MKQKKKALSRGEKILISSCYKPKKKPNYHAFIFW